VHSVDICAFRHSAPEMSLPTQGDLHCRTDHREAITSQYSYPAASRNTMSVLHTHAASAERYSIHIVLYTTQKYKIRHNLLVITPCSLVGDQKRFGGRLRLKCDGTRAETRFRLSAKQTSPFKSAGESVQSTTGSRVVRISGSNAGYTMFRGSVKNTGYPLHSPVSPSLPLPCVAVCHQVSNSL